MRVAGEHILTGQDLESSHEPWPHVGPMTVHDGSTWDPHTVQVRPTWDSRTVQVGPHGTCILFMWDPHTIQLGPAHKIYLIIFYI